MKIAVYEVESWERAAFTPLAREHELVFREEALTAGNVDDVRDATIVSTFIYSDLRRPTLDALPELRLIATRSTGVDHIDAEHCARRGIAIVNVPTYGTNTVAEHTFALLLAISHRIVDAVERTRSGRFSHRGLQGFDLHGRTLGVIGTGDIGEHVACIGVGFGMRVVAFDPVRKESLAREVGVDYVELNELLRESDVVTLHAPLNEHTRHMLSTDEFAAMKPGVVILNTARGELIDVRALAEALADGKVSAAGLDVLPEEPALREEAELLRTAFRRKHDLDAMLAGHILLHQPNVLVTPHSAFNTREAVQRILDTTVENIVAFVRGAPQNLVGPQARSTGSGAPRGE